MMFKIRFKQVIFLWIFLFTFLSSLLWGSEIVIPLPVDSIQVLEKNFNIGPTKGYIKFYTTSFGEKKINNFFDKEMVNAGWHKERGNSFVKGDSFVTIGVLKLASKDNKTRFSVTAFRMPQKDEILASNKETPDKVSFMPTYPGSKQNLFWYLPVGATASYGTKDSIKEVVFFYKSGMLNYGWSLFKEAPIKTEAINSSEYKKAINNLPAGSPKIDIQGSLSKTSLEFHRGDGEICKIDLYQNNLDFQGNPEVANNSMDSNSTTTILVTYYANKENNI